MKHRNAAEIDALSDVCSVTSSQITASDGRPSASFSAASAAWDSAVSMSSTAIDPSRWMPRPVRSSITTLASSRATSHRITSPWGLWAASRSTITLITVGHESSAPSAASVLSGGATIRRWTMSGL
jgi:hypothetical protein